MRGPLRPRWTIPLPNPRAFPDSTTIYTVVTTGGACNDTATVKVTVWDTAYITSHTGSFAWCPNDPAFLTAQGGVVVQWYHNGDSIIPGDQQRVLATDTGWYRAVIQSCALGGLDTVSVHIYNNPPTAIYLPNDTVFLCPNGSASLQVIGGNQYKWYATVTSRPTLPTRCTRSAPPASTQSL